jgi:endonuclease YncB( thermonuclease family)
MFVNQHMLYQGHGLFSGSGTNLKYASVLNEAAEVAKNQGRGIWTFFGPAPPERK